MRIEELRPQLFLHIMPCCTIRDVSAFSQTNKYVRTIIHVFVAHSYVPPSSFVGNFDCAMISLLGQRVETPANIVVSYLRISLITHDIKRILTDYLPVKLIADSASQCGVDRFPLPEPPFYVPALKAGVMADAFLAAATYGHLRIAKIFMDGAYFIPNSFQISRAFLLAASQGYHQIVELFLSTHSLASKLPRNDKVIALREAAARGDLATVNVFLRCPMEYVAASPYLISSLEMAAHAALSAGHRRVRRLISHTIIQLMQDIDM